MIKSPLHGREAVSYARWSSGRQTVGSSLERQTQRAREYCVRTGMTLLSSIVDQGVSAFTGSNLNAGLGRFIDGIRSGAVSSNVVLLIENLDRFSRMNPMDVLPTFTSALDTGLTIVTLHDERVHTRDLYRENVFQLMQSLMSMQLAHEESKKKSDRGKGAWAARVEKLKRGERVPISKVPFWIDQSTQGFNARVDDAHLIFQLAKDGNGASVITRTLNERGIPSSQGGTWGKSMVQDVLKSKAAYGAYEVKDYEQRDYFPPIIDEDTWMAIAARAASQRRNPQAAKTANLFPRLLYCAECGAPMNVTTTSAQGKRYKYASCSMRTTARNNCTAPNWPYDKFERRFVDKVAELIGDTRRQPTDTPERTEAASLQSQLEALLTQQQNAIDLSIATEQEQVRTQFLRRAEALGREIASIQRRLADITALAAEKRTADGQTERVLSALKEARIMRRNDRVGLQSIIASVVRSIRLQAFDRNGVNVAEVEMRKGDVDFMAFDPEDFI